MLRVRCYTLTAIYVLILSPFAFGFHEPLAFYPPINPIHEVIIPPEGYPGIQFQVNYGPFKHKKCEYPDDCPPPPPGFGVVVEWQNPNGPGANPDCWVLEFEALAGMTDTWYNIRFGEGSIQALDHTLNTCCWPPLSCDVNRYIFTVGPLPSGTYRVRLFSYDWYEWYPGMGCEPQQLFGGWGQGRWEEEVSAFKTVTNTLIDYISFTHIYYADTDPVEPDTVYNGGFLGVLTDYYIYCNIRSTLPPAGIPIQLTGYLYPEDVFPSQVIFTRWPEGDTEAPCDGSYPLRNYGYRSILTYKPLDVFYNVPPEDWETVTKLLECKLFGDENGVRNDVENTVTVMSLMHLDRANDTTMCFIPVAQQKMDFGFMFNRHALGLNEGSDVRFQVTDKDDNLVFEDPVRIGFIESDPNDFGLPDFPQVDSMGITWNGRVNRGEDIDHLANPHNDPYTAQVHIFENDVPVISSNAEGFNVVPLIDSVLVTHTPCYLPADYPWPLYLYSIIRGKIDDAGDPYIDYTLFIPENETLPSNVRLWDGDDYMFHDALPSSPVTYFYEFFNEPLIVENWQSQLWGDLTYNWYHVKDWAYKIGDDSFIGYEDRDTTAWWGSDWNPWFTNWSRWFDREGLPYMRLLVRSKAIIDKNNYIVESAISSGTYNSHKIITSQYWGIGHGEDILFWAKSHVGVPYYYLGQDPRGGKVPYIQIDCSGLVTAARIEDLEPGNNHNYRLNSNNVASYVAGYYKYGGEVVSTLTEVIMPSQAARGDLVALRSMRNWNDWSKAHIAIIDWIIADPETQKIYGAFIIHANGRSDPVLRRVRYDNLLATFRPWWNGGFSGGLYEYEFLRFLTQ